MLRKLKVLGSYGDVVAVEANGVRVDVPMREIAGSNSEELERWLLARVDREAREKAIADRETAAGYSSLQVLAADVARRGDSVTGAGDGI